MVTIFTPTYNRAYILSQLYDSLCRQSSNDFEWIVVDDGSTDDTDDLVNQFINENKIRIQYFKQKNGGKHRAINTGVRKASGDLFFIVDSDDYVTDDAVEWILNVSEQIMKNNAYAGLSGIRIKPNGDKIGGGPDFGIIDANAIDLRLHHGVTGDLAEVYKTEILRKYPFPEFEGERFCPEALVWFRIARHYRMRFYHKGIYICEYLPDGLTAKITRLRRQSPQASMTFYSEHFHDNISLKWKIKAAINFWRFNFASYENHRYRMLNPLSIISWVPGKLMQIIDSNK